MDEVLNLFNDGGVRYLVIGGQAVRLAGMPRFTMDWDFYVPPRDAENIRRINELMGKELDVPLVDRGPRGENFVQTYQTRWGIVQFHLGVPGLPEFEKVESRACTRQTETGVPVRCVSDADLLRCKRAASRPQDQQDIHFLEMKAAAGHPDDNGTTRQDRNPR